MPNTSTMMSMPYPMARLAIYLLDVVVLKQLMQQHQLQFLDPFKTVNVSDLRTMAVVVVVKG